MVNDHSQLEWRQSPVTCLSFDCLAESTQGPNFKETQHLMKTARSACVLAGLLLLGTTILTFSQAEPDPWLIVPNGDGGAINYRVSRAELAQRYGAANVVDEEVGVGEGDTDTATVLFPKDSERRIEILWQDREKEAYPSSVSVSGKASRWHAVHGISLGMPYSELSRINGKPFPISWGTDQGNVVLSWNGGLLDKDLKDVRVWFDDLPTGHATKKEASSIGGSANQKRRVNQIAWGFLAQTP